MWVAIYGMLPVCQQHRFQVRLPRPSLLSSTPCACICVPLPFLLHCPEFAMFGRSPPLNRSSLPKLLLVSQTRARHFLNTFSHLLSLFSCISNFSSNMSTWSRPWRRHEPTYKKFEPQSLPPHLLRVIPAPCTFPPPVSSL